MQKWQRNCGIIKNVATTLQCVNAIRVAAESARAKCHCIIVADGFRFCAASGGAGLFIAYLVGEALLTMNTFLYIRYFW